MTAAIAVFSSTGTLTNSNATSSHNQRFKVLQSELLKFKETDNWAAPWKIAGIANIIAANIILSIAVLAVQPGSSGMLISLCLFTTLTSLSVGLFIAEIEAILLHAKKNASSAIC